jgi:serine/threonine protein kinase
LGPVGSVNLLTAVAVSRRATWVYRSIVNAIVECRASSFASFGCTPAVTRLVMNVCRSEWKTEPVKRLVALKLIKAGMDSKQVLARFEAERQALALMDHPNIARVLDAGATWRFSGTHPNPSEMPKTSRNVGFFRHFVGLARHAIRCVEQCGFGGVGGFLAS